MTIVTVKQLIIVEKRTVCAAVADSISYSNARLELLRDVGNALAINSDCATTPSKSRAKIIKSAMAGPTIKRVKQLTNTVLLKIVRISIVESCAPNVISATATKPSAICSIGILNVSGIGTLNKLSNAPKISACTIGIFRKSRMMASPDFVDEMRLYNPYV